MNEINEMHQIMVERVKVALVRIENIAGDPTWANPNWPGWTGAISQFNEAVKELLAFNNAMSTVKEYQKKLKA